MSTNAELLSACDVLAAELLRNHHAITTERRHLDTLLHGVESCVAALASIRADVEANTLTMQSLALSVERDKRFCDTHAFASSIVARHKKVPVA